jgi:hypothetical protein
MANAWLRTHAERQWVAVGYNFIFPRKALDHDFFSDFPVFLRNHEHIPVTAVIALFNALIDGVFR